jgi:hypothetical protein
MTTLFEMESACLLVEHLVLKSSDKHNLGDDTFRTHTNTRCKPKRQETHFITIFPLLVKPFGKWQLLESVGFLATWQMH